MIGEAVRLCGTVDILVNNAGVGLTKLLLQTSLDEWDHVLRVNLTGAFLCARPLAASP
jgi:NAD(P)-dependent dehydrogenase (short-subunit alcohol dehydrogenase family)